MITDNTQEQGSEVARLLKQIREEYAAAQQGLSGLAYGTSRHAFITAKMEILANCMMNCKRWQATGLLLLSSRMNYSFNPWQEKRMYEFGQFHAE
jgi:hypothetical protein